MKRPRFLREVASVPTLVVVALTVLLGLPATIMLTPDQHTTVAGQELAVGARTPSLSWSGPAQLVQIGNTKLDLVPLQIVGPLRPRITLGPVQRNAAAAAALDPTNGDAKQTAQSQIVGAFLRWYGVAAAILLAITIGLVALVACVRMMITLRRESRADAEPRSVAELWHRSRAQVHAMGVAAVITALLAWAGSGALAYNGVVDGLSHVRSLTDLVGSRYVATAPVGPVIDGYAGAVIGDSRASRLGGTVAPEAPPQDHVCRRTTDSLAAQIGALTLQPVANLACSGASTLVGLRGWQYIGDQEIPPQIGRLRQLSGLEFVVVVIGPNDLGWSDQIGYCYVADCQDRLTEGEFAYRLAAFDRAYGDLLHDLNDLPGAPQIIIMTSYDVFSLDAVPEVDPEAEGETAEVCADARGPVGTSGLTRPNIELLIERNRQFNDVLIAGAEKYGFILAHPVLTPLCSSDSGGLGPDLQGLGDPAPFHPTGIGMLRLASSVVRVLA